MDKQPVIRLKTDDIYCMDDFIENVEKIICSIAELSDRQSDCLRKKNIDGFLSVIEEKELLINEIKKSNDFLNSKINDSMWSRYLKNELCVNRLKKIQSATAELVKNDHQCLRSAMILKDRAYSELTKLFEGKKALGSYKPAMDNDLNIGWKG